MHVKGGKSVSFFRALLKPRPHEKNVVWTHLALAVFIGMFIGFLDHSFGTGVLVSVLLIIFAGTVAMAGIRGYKIAYYVLFLGYLYYLYGLSVAMDGSAIGDETAWTHPVFYLLFGTPLIYTTSVGCAVLAQGGYVFGRKWAERVKRNNEQNQGK